jgi:thioredoxin reductase (NADPH)
MTVKDLVSGEARELATEGVFVFIGSEPRVDLLRALVPLDASGYVLAGEDMSTTVPGLFVAGDLRSKSFRQITTAVADGTIAALAAQKFVKAAAHARA